MDNKKIKTTELREQIAKRYCERCDARSSIFGSCLASYELGKCPGYYTETDYTLSLFELWLKGQDAQKMLSKDNPTYKCLAIIQGGYRYCRVEPLRLEIK